MAKKVTRGIRNNNPGNIRINSDLFLGEVKPSQDKEFKQFETMAHGYRAIFKILSNYYNRYSLKTIRQMIMRWAPPTENKTDKYIQYVASIAGVGADDTIRFSDRELMVKIVMAISRMENGIDADKNEVEDGWNMLFAK